MEVDEFREDLLESARARAGEGADRREQEFAFVCEMSKRLADAEEFHDFVPIQYAGTGSRNRRLRVDGYEFDDADDSMRIAIAELSSGDETETLTRTRAEALFGQVLAFVEDSISGRIFSSSQFPELSTLISQKHGTSVTRYRFYLLTDLVLSGRVKDLPVGEVEGCPVEYHVWDAGRMLSIAASALGTEEIDIDFTEFLDGGLPCLEASRADDYSGYLCVIPGNALAGLYERYGSRLLEGNVRSFLSASGKINKGIQGTIRAEPARFFVYNNGISATATAVTTANGRSGLRLQAATCLQIVNGGQTTASLFVARKKDKADLSRIHVPMKLSVVEAADADSLDEMIQKIAMYSNKQNKVSDADFFSNHPFHRAIERMSRRVPAPAASGAQFQTNWFYERARGQYANELSKLTPRARKEFQRINPRSQLLTKTDLAKYENSFRQLPHTVSLGAQKNFVSFATYVESNFGEAGAKFENETYFKQAISRAIIFRWTERMVSESGWYEGGYRANIVTYTVARLARMIDEGALGCSLDYGAVWARQGLSPLLAEQIQAIAKAVVGAITSPPVEAMNVTEWCKKSECWEKVRSVEVTFLAEFRKELLTPERAGEIAKQARSEGKLDVELNAEIEVAKLGSTYWVQLEAWCTVHEPLFGKEADLVKLAGKKSWVPSAKQAKVLLDVRRRMEVAGFRGGEGSPT